MNVADVRTAVEERNEEDRQIGPAIVHRHVHAHSQTHTHAPMQAHAHSTEAADNADVDISILDFFFSDVK